MIFILLLLCVPILLYYLYFIKPKRYWKDRGLNEKANNTMLYFLATAIQRMAQADLLMNSYNLNPNSRYTAMYHFGPPFLLIRDPELLKLITVKDFDHFLDHRPFIDPESDPVWGRTLMTLKGQEWKEMRATMSGAFTSAKMRLIFGLIKEVAENYVKHFEKQKEDIIELEMKQAFHKYTCDVIATAAFGVTVDSFENPTNEFYETGKDATDFAKMSVLLKFMGYMLVPKLFKYLKVSLFGSKTTNFFKNLIEETIKVREQKNIVRPDMVNILLEAKKGVLQQEENVVDAGFAVTKEYSDTHKVKKLSKVTNDDIVSQAVIFFIAGFESSANLMSFMAYELGVNQDVQQKLREEVMATLKHCKGDVTYEALLKMKYMDMVVTETLRKWPVIIATDRVCVKPYVIQPVLPHESPVEIRVGDIVIVPSMGFHRDPQYFPDPMKFDPERFSEENKHNIVPYTYMPFGIGPRNCIGSRFALLETKCIMFYLLSNFEIVPCEKSQIPLKLCTKTMSMTSKGGFWFGLRRIKNEDKI